MGRLCGRSNFRPKILWIMEIISVKRTFKSSGTTSNNNIGRKLTKHPDGIKTINGQDVDKITSSVIWIYFLTQRKIIRKICSIAMSTSYTPFWTKTLCLCLLDGSERFYPALSLGFCMHVCTPLESHLQVWSSPSWIQSLLYTVPWETNVTQTKVFQSRKANVSDHHSTNTARYPPEAVWCSTCSQQD